MALGGDVVLVVLDLHPLPTANGVVDGVWDSSAAVSNGSGYLLLAHCLTGEARECHTEKA
jgi:hypothetical protein